MGRDERELQSIRNIRTTHMVLYPEMQDSILVIEAVQRQLMDVMKSELDQVMVESRLRTASPLECVEAHVNPGISYVLEKHRIPVE